ncbi:hypothetical protein AVEN_249699-1 [Araneus ventricosus]|uniref:Uncharacterized protein n=1 Tax=Araneus ventricosus TaxID=182803 RepID=A0A4Y2TK45_ARAVE|nr:hypothetical protein AVEN_249699-1 [Araneus ventricosus]
MRYILLSFSTKDIESPDILGSSSLDRNLGLQMIRAAFGLKMVPANISNDVDANVFTVEMRQNVTNAPEIVSVHNCCVGSSVMKSSNFYYDLRSILKSIVTQREK